MASTVKVSVPVAAVVTAGTSLAPERAALKASSPAQRVVLLVGTVVELPRRVVVDSWLRVVEVSPELVVEEAALSPHPPTRTIRARTVTASSIFFMLSGHLLGNDRR